MLNFLTKTSEVSPYLYTYVHYLCYFKDYAQGKNKKEGQTSLP